MTKPVVYGARYSVYVRSVLLALAEKGVDHDVVEVDVFAPGGPPPEHLARHPFGKIPAFEHGAVRLYEAAAIARYVDEGFDGPALQPDTPAGRARMAQAIGILDAYAYRCWVWDIYVERVSVPKRGGVSDEARIASATGRAATCASAIVALIGASGYLPGPQLSLADLHAAPMLAYLVKAPEGAQLLDRHATLWAWWERLRKRPSVATLCA